MRILHIIGTVDPKSGGPIEGIIRREPAMTAFGPGVREVATLDHPDAPFLRDFPLTVYPLGIKPRHSNPPRGYVARYNYSPKFIPWLRAHAGDYDCVIVNGLWNFTTYGASAVLPRGPVPYFVYTHGMMDPWFRRRYPFKHLLKLASWLLCEGPLLHHATGVFFTAEEERILARGQFPGYSYREHIVGYGAAEPPPATPEQDFAFRGLLPRLGRRPYLLFLSRIHPKKGCDLLIKAFAGIAARHPMIDLVMAGPDQTNWRPELEGLARMLSVAERVHWPGMVGQDTKWAAYRGATAFVLPTHQENFGLVIAEAMACGTPVLITDKVNIWGTVAAGGGGFVERDDEAGITRLLERYFALGDADRETMRRAARRTYEDHFTVEVAVENLMRVVSNATVRPNGNRP